MAQSQAKAGALAKSTETKGKDKKDRPLNRFMGGCLYAVSRLFFIMYLFGSPLFIEDELRRVDPKFNVAKLFLPVVAMVKFFFGVMHMILKSNSKEVTRLLLTMIALSGPMLHSPLNTDNTFHDLYRNVAPSPPSSPLGTDGATTSSTSSFAFLSESLPFDIEIPIPRFLDSANMASGMTDNVASVPVNNINLTAYHWLIVLGVISSIACHMVNYEDYAAIGRIGLGIWLILYGVALLLLPEFQRPWMFVLAQYKVVNASMSHSELMRIMMMVAFTACFAGLTLCQSSKWKKLGIFLAIGYVLVLCIYEVESFMVGQQHKIPEDGRGGKEDINRNLESMLDHPEYWVYPMDYQMLRLINLCMLLSGTIFELLKIYNPEHALGTQKDFEALDEEEDEVDEIVEPEALGEERKETKSKGKGKRRDRKGNKKRKGKESKKRK